MMASSIGLVVTAGITNTFVQMSQRIRQIEAKQQREIFYNYIRRHFKNEQACIATLDAKGGTGTPSQYYTPNVFYGDAAGTKDPDGDNINDHEWTIPKLLKADGTDELDFLRQKPSTDAAKKALEKKFWEKWGIEKFDSIMFIHDTAHGSHLRVHIWNIAPGGMPYPAGPYMIPLTVTTAPAASPAQGKEITKCDLEGVAQSAKEEEDLSCPEREGLDDGDSHSNGGGFVARTATVASRVHVGPNAKVCGKAEVKGNVRITDTAKVFGKVKIEGPADSATGVIRIYNQAQVSGDAKVSGSGYINQDAVIDGEAEVVLAPSPLFPSYGTVNSSARITDNARVTGSVVGDAIVRGDAQFTGGLSGSAIIEGNAIVTAVSPAAISGNVIIGGDARVTGGVFNGHAVIDGNARISSGGVSGYAKVGGDARVTGGGVSGNAIVDGGIISGGSVSGDAKVSDRAEVSGGSVSGDAKIYGDAKVKGGTIIGNTKIYGDAIVNSGTHYNKTYSTGTHN